MASQVSDIFGGRSEQAKLEEQVRQRRSSHGQKHAAMGLRGEHLATANFMSTLLDVGLSKWGKAGAKGMANETQTAQIQAQNEYQKVVDKERRAGGRLAADNPELEGNAQERQHRMMEIAAETAYANGLPGKGLEISQAVSDARYKQKNKDLAIRNLETGVELGENRLERDKKYGDANAETEYAANQNKGLKQAWIKKADGTWSQQAVSGYLGADKKLQVGEEKYGAGEWTTLNPNKTEALKNSKAGKMALMRATISPTEQKELRARGMALADTVKVNNRIIRLMGEAAKEGDINFMDGSGKTANFLRRATDNLQGIYREAGKNFNLPVVDASGKARSFKLAQKDPNSPISEAWDGLGRQTAAWSQEYQGLVMDLAYATARANEPGARLSDADIANAIRVIGGNATDPATFASMARNNVERGREDFQNHLDILGPDISNAVVGPRFLNTLNEGFAEFDGLTYETDEDGTFIEDSDGNKVRRQFGTAGDPSMEGIQRAANEEQVLSMGQRVPEPVYTEGVPTPVQPVQPNDPVGEVREAQEEPVDYESLMGDLM